MTIFNVTPAPDFGRFEKMLLRKGAVDRAVIFELYSCVEDDVLAYLGIDAPKGTYDQLSEMDFLKRHIIYNYTLGYDFVNVWCRRGMTFPAKAVGGVGQDGKTRHFQQAGLSVINSREDFEKYPWPDMAGGDYSLLEKCKAMIPDGMKVVTGHPGILEMTMYLLGYEGMSFKLFEDPQLVKDVVDEVGGRIVKHLEICSQFDSVGAVQLGDDLGFCTQTLFSPEVYRRFLFPWHKKAVDVIHASGKIAFLHACGNRGQIMQDIIDCGWDAIHSFEDKIAPIWEVKSLWGHRIAVLGGFDVDKVSTLTPVQVREHTRMLINKCGRSGWALGTGNSVPDYTPIENFLAMIDEAFKAW
jgi:uroporphyrinogen decarboxylase